MSIIHRLFSESHSFKIFLQVEDSIKEISYYLTQKHLQYISVYGAQKKNMNIFTNKFLTKFSFQNSFIALVL